MQFGQQQQQQQQQQLHPQQQPQLGVSWKQQQQPAVGMLGQSASAAPAGRVSTESFMLQWQQLQQAHSQQQLAAAAAAGLAAKAAAVAAAASTHGAHQCGSSIADFDMAAGSVYDCQDEAVNGQQLPSEDIAVGMQQPGGRRDSTSTAGRATSSRRVSSADDIMFVMEDGGSGQTPTKRSAQSDEVGTRPPHTCGNLAGDNHLDQLQVAGRLLSQHPRVKQLAGRPELIASSPLELCPIEEQPGGAAAEGSLAQHQVTRQPPQGVLQPVLPAVQLLDGRRQQQQQQQEEETRRLLMSDLELQEAEVLSEHPGDWDPLYSDEQLLDEQTSPAAAARQLLPAAALTAARPAGEAVAGRPSHSALVPHPTGPDAAPITTAATRRTSGTVCRQHGTSCL